MNLTDSHTSLQSSHSCKFKTVAWVVELTYLHVIVKCESLLGGHCKTRVLFLYSSSACFICEAMCSLKLAVFHKMKPLQAGESFMSLVLNLGTSRLGDRELCNESFVGCAKL